MSPARRHLASAKLRAGRRKDGAGAVMFIVAMTVAVLAAMGLYALHAASTEVKTSGYERQNAQTHYLAEYGVLGGAQEVAGTKVQLYVGLMVAKPDTGCLSLDALTKNSTYYSTATPLSKACRRMGAGELVNTATGWATPVLDPYANGKGSFGTAPIGGDFFIELTDPAQTTPPAGYDQKLGLCFTQITLSANGITRPFIQGGTSPEQFTYGNEGLEGARARIIGGPMRCAQ